MLGLSFLSPVFLVGLLTATIPVIIHLIHRRKTRTVPFSTLMFLRLSNDGEKAVVAFCGEPEVKKVVWNNAIGQYEDYDERQHDATPQARFKINVFNISQNKMQIWETSPTTFKGVVAVKAKYGLDKMTFEICRQGAKGDQKTSYTILPEDPITDELRERILNEKLHDLLVDGRGKDTKSKAEDGNGHNDNIASIIHKLKGLEDASAVKTFLTKFEVQKIKELKPEQVPAAMAFIEAIGKKDDRSDEVDPFA